MLVNSTSQDGTTRLQSPDGEGRQCATTAVHGRLRSPSCGTRYGVPWILSTVYSRLCWLSHLAEWPVLRHLRPTQVTSPRHCDALLVALPLPRVQSSPYYVEYVAMYSSSLGRPPAGQHLRLVRPSPPCPVRHQRQHLIWQKNATTAQRLLSGCPGPHILRLAPFCTARNTSVAVHATLYPRGRAEDPHHHCSQLRRTGCWHR